MSADPADINILGETLDDPRTVDKLVDGTNHTWYMLHYDGTQTQHIFGNSDDLHAWLAPFSAGENHFVYLDLDEVLYALWFGFASP